MLYADAAQADWVNLTGAETAPNIAEITVLDDRVRVALEIYIADIETFQDLLPEAWISKYTTTLEPLEKRLQRFSEETFQIVTDKGIQLQAERRLIEPRMRKDRVSPFAGMIDPRTRQRVPGAPEDKRVFYVELEYPFAGKPETLTFVPPQTGDNAVAVTIGFIAYHKSVPIIDFRYLSEPATLRLDWNDPWYSRFDNRNLTRHHESALMSFLYVEPREVRHEVLIRVRDLQDWTELGLGAKETIDTDDQDRLKQRAEVFLAALNPVEIDGMERTPTATRSEFLTVSLTGLQVVEGNKPLDASTALLGAILSYPVEHIPQHVTMRWDMFSDRVQQLPATAIDPAGPFPTFIKASDPVFEWRNFLRTYEEPTISPVVVDDGRTLRIPVLSVILLVVALGAAALAIRGVLPSRRIWLATSAVSVVTAGLVFRLVVVEPPNPFAGSPTEGTVKRILSEVLTNVNHAFIEKDPEAIRKALELIIADNGRADVAAELERALAIEVAGGSIARVEAIDDIELTDVANLENGSGFRTFASWTAEASAGHWGHIHRRTIRFRAFVELVDVDGAWKLGGITVIDARAQG